MNNKSAQITFVFKTPNLSKTGGEVKSFFKEIEKEAESTGRRINKSLSINPVLANRINDNQFKDQIKAAEKAASAQTLAFMKAAEAAQKAQDRASKAAQRAADKEFKEIQRIHAEKIKLAERAGREQEKAAQVAAKAQEKASQQSVRAAEKAEREKLRAAERTAKEQERLAHQVQRAQEKAARDAARAQQAIDRESQRNAERNRFSPIAQSSGSATRNAGRGAVAAGATLTATVTAPLALFADYAMEIGQQYDQAMNVFQATTRATADEMERAARVAQELGADMDLPATSAADAGLAMLALAKRSFTAKEAIEAARGVLQLSAAAHISEAEAAGIAADAINSFNLKASDSTKITDLLAGASTAAGAEITQVAEALQQSSAVFHAANVPIEDVVTSIALMAKAGIRGTDAGTSLKTMMLALLAPTKKAREEMQHLGIEVYDSQGKLKSYRDVVEQFSKAMSGMTDEAKNRALKDILGQDAIRAGIIVLSSGIDTFDKMAEKVTRAGVAAQIAAARMKGLPGAVEGLKSVIESFALVVYNQFKGPLEAAYRALIDIIGGATLAFMDFAKAHPGIVKIIGAVISLAAALGPVLLLIGGLVIAAGAIIAAMGSAASAIGAAAAVFGGLLPLIAAVIGGIAQLAIQVVVIVAVLTTAAIAIYEAWQNNIGGLRDFVLTAWEEIKNGVDAATQFLVELWNQYGPGLIQTAQAVWGAVMSTVESAVREIVTFASQNFQVLVDWVRENWPLIKDFISKEMKAIGIVVQAVLGQIQAYWTIFGPYVMSVLRTAWTLIKAAFSTGFSTILGIVQFAMAVLTGNWSKAGQALVSVAKGWTDGLKAAFFAIAGLFYQFGPKVYVEALKLGLTLIEKIISGITGSNAAGRIGSAIVSAIFPGLMLARSMAESQGAAAGAAFSSAFQRGLQDQTAGNGNGFGGGWDPGKADAANAEKAQQAAEQTAAARQAAAAANRAGGGGSGGGSKTKAKKDELDAYRKVLEDLQGQYRAVGESSEEFAAKSKFLEAMLGQLNGQARDYVDTLARTQGIDAALEGGFSKLTPKIQQQARALYESSIAQAKDLDLKKNTQKLGDDLNRQLVETRQRLVELGQPLEDNATEVNKFDLAIAKAREESEEMARVLDANKTQLAAVRAEWGRVDAAVKNQKWHKEIAEAIKAAEEAADEAKTSLRDFGRESSSNVEKVIDKFSKLKGLDLKREDLDVLKSMSESLAGMPEPARLTAIATAIDLIFADRKGKLTPEEWDKLRLAMLAAANAAVVLDSAMADKKVLETYTKAMEDLNGKLVETADKTETARVQQLLLTEAYKNLTEEQKKNLLVKAAEVDKLKQLEEIAKAQKEAIERFADAIADVFGKALDQLFDGHIKGFFKAIGTGFKQLFIQIVRDYLMSGLKRVIEGLLGIGDGASSRGGGISGILGSILNIFRGSGSTTGPNAPIRNVQNLTQSGNSNPISAVLSSLTGNGNGSFAANILGGSGTTAAAGSFSLTSGTLTQTVANQVSSNILTHEAGHGVGIATTSAAGKTGFLSGLGGMLPLLGAGVGASLGGLLSGGEGGLGGILTQVGGGILGLYGGTLGALATVGATSGSTLATLGATLGTLAPFLLPLAGVALVGGYFLARNKKRRREEGIRDQALGDAFAQLQELLKGVKADRIDGTDAIGKALSIRSDYLQTANSLKDKKTRNHALADVSRLDTYIAQIRLEADAQQSRKTTLANRKPEFATGGIVPGPLGSPVDMTGHGGEIFINPGQMAGIGAAVLALSGVPGVAGLPFAVPHIQPSAGTQGSASDGDIHIDLYANLVVGTETAGDLVEAGASTRQGSKAIAKVVSFIKSFGGK